MLIGNFDIYMIDAGRYRLDGGAMFGVVPRVLWQKQHPPDEKNRILMSLNTLLLVGEGRNILIDTGVGNKFSEKFSQIYAIDHSEYSLIKSLAGKNIQPEDITDVIITHLHFDHVGGATCYDSEGNLTLQFPNATHYIQKEQLDWAQKGFEKDRASYLSENIEPLLKSDKLKILHGETELFTGVNLILSDGHTPGQQMVLISGDERNLLYAADVMPLSSHISVPWVMAYDLEPKKTIEEKKQILNKAAAESWMIFFEHDPETYCATIEKGDKGFRIKSRVKL